jgi:hypothetical protein
MVATRLVDPNKSPQGVFDTCRQLTPWDFGEPMKERLMLGKLCVIHVEEALVDDVVPPPGAYEGNVLSEGCAERWA